MKQNILSDAELLATCEAALVGLGTWPEPNGLDDPWIRVELTTVDAITKALSAVVLRATTVLENMKNQKQPDDRKSTAIFRKELSRLGVPRRQVPHFYFWNGQFRKDCELLGNTDCPLIIKAMARCLPKTFTGARAIAAYNKWVKGFDAKLAARLLADPLAGQAFYHGFMIACGAFTATNKQQWEALRARPSRIP